MNHIVKKQPKILRELAVKILFRKIANAGVDINVDDILVAPYTSLGILVPALKTLPGKGDIILSPEGFYKSNADHIISAGYKLSTFPTDKETHKIQPETLLSAIREAKKSKGGLKGILLTIPGNPFLVEYSLEELQAIAKVIIQEDMYVVCDSAFDSVVPNYFPLAAVKVPISDGLHTMYDRVVTITGNSKSHSATGPLKFGAACTGNEAWKLRLADTLVIGFQRETTSAVAQLLMCTPDEYFEECANVMCRQQQAAKQYIEATNRYLGYDALQCLGENRYGPFLCISLSKSLLDKAGVKDSWQLFEMLLAVEKIDSVPLMTTGTHEIGVRINIHAPRNGVITMFDEEVIKEQFCRLQGLAEKIQHGLTYEESLKKLVTTQDPMQRGGANLEKRQPEQLAWIAPAMVDK